MPALQLSIETRDPEALEAACFEAGAVAVTLLDAADVPILEPAPGATPLWPLVRLVALFEERADRAAIGRAIEDVTGQGLPGNARFELIADRPWEREWLRDFRPMRFGARLWVCPHGQFPAQDDATIVWLDPGIAFGTGSHETTAMCLSWLDVTDVRGLEVTDYGCGSGILAIAAAKLGARLASAVDLDPQALVATRDNAQRNGVAERIEILSTADPAPLADVLLANILAQPLIELAPRFKSMVRPGGVLVLSGILSSQAVAVASAYAPWFDMRSFATLHDWVCLEGVRR